MRNQLERVQKKMSSTLKTNSSTKRKKTNPRFNAVMEKILQLHRLYEFVTRDSARLKIIIL